MNGRELTGRHVFLITAGAFAVIIGVNLTLAVNAVSTFPGLEVKNSYVASQSFDRERAAQESLGWSAEAKAEDGLLKLWIRDRYGNAVTPEALDATLGRATHVAEDQSPSFVFDGDAWVAPVALDRGRWSLRIEAEAADGTVFRQHLDVRFGLPG